MWSSLRYSETLKPRERAGIAMVTLAYVVVLLLPFWKIGSVVSVADKAFQMIEIFPIGAFGGNTEENEGQAAVQPTVEEIKAEWGEAQEAADKIAEETGLEQEVTIGQVLANVPHGILPEVAGGNSLSAPKLPPAPMRLEEIIIVKPEIAVAPVMVEFPLIRNPSIMKRFLRARYNPLFQNPGETGTVSVAIWVNERGVVESAAVQESSGHPSLDAIAVSLFEEIASFYPARRGRQAVPVQVTIAVPFMVPW